MRSSQRHNEAVIRSNEPGKVPFWARVTAGTLVVASSFGLASMSQEASAKTAKGDSKTATVSEKLPNKMEKNPKILIPNSTDMATNVRAWVTNFLNYKTTGDEKFLQFYVVSTDSSVAQQLNDERQKVASYQAQQHSKYHFYLPTGAEGVKIVEDMTTFPNSGTTVTADIEIQDFLDNRAVDPYSRNDYRMQYTVGKFERPDPYHAGQMVEVVLPTFIHDLGTPPVQPQSNALGKHGF